MPYVASVGTYLPCWGSSLQRVAGDDEDAVTMAVEAGRAALTGGGAAERVVVVSRDLPLLESSNAAVLLAGLGLDPELEVDERLGVPAERLGVHDGGVPQHHAVALEPVQPPLDGRSGQVDVLADV